MPEEQVEVQLGDDLTESLRALKVSIYVFFVVTERMSYPPTFDSLKGISSVIDSLACNNEPLLNRVCLSCMFSSPYNFPSK